MGTQPSRTVRDPDKVFVGAYIPSQLKRKAMGVCQIYGCNMSDLQLALYENLEWLVLMIELRDRRQQNETRQRAG